MIEIDKLCVTNPKTKHENKKHCANISICFLCVLTIYPMLFVSIIRSYVIQTFLLFVAKLYVKILKMNIGFPMFVRQIFYFLI